MITTAEVWPFLRAQFNQSTYDESSEVQLNELLVTFSKDHINCSLSRREESCKNKLFACLSVRTSLIGPRIM